MRSRFPKWIPFAAFLVGVAAFAGPQAAEQLASESRRTTAGGATYSAPAGWSLRSAPSMVVLDPPEANAHLALVDVQGADAAAAVTAAWATYQPDFKRPVKLVTPVPPRDGWEESKNFEYETSPNERRVLQARARRAGDRWTVIILDGAEGTFEKRNSQFALIVQSLRPKGYQRESFTH